MADETEKKPDVQSEESEDENPIKKKSSFVMTEARKATLARGRAKRQENIKRIQEGKMKKQLTQKIVKKEVKQRLENEVRAELEAVNEAKSKSEEDDKPTKKPKTRRAKPTTPSSSEAGSSSDSDSDYEIEIRRRKDNSRYNKPLSEKKYGVPIMFV